MGQRERRLSRQPIDLDSLSMATDPPTTRRPVKGNPGRDLVAGYLIVANQTIGGEQLTAKLDELVSAGSSALRNRTPWGPSIGDRMTKRTLILLPDAKSDWSADEADIARPLAKRGRCQAPDAGRWLARTSTALASLSCHPPVALGAPGTSSRLG